MLIVGLGPAGFTLAHHLMNDGHTVVAVDGLKIEPLGFDPSLPVRDVATLYENLDDRVMAGFGGVAEYGITVRWNKNYLKLVRLLLERREKFAHFGGIRFGGGATLTIDDAWAMGFDHIALCMGAGKPTVLDIPNGLARGVRAGVGFPDGVATDRRGEKVVHCQPATAAAGGGDRRRADRDRYGDRKSSLTMCGRWRNSPHGIARWWRSAAQPAGGRRKSRHCR